MRSATETVLPLRDATGRASTELEALHERLERLEHALETVVQDSPVALDRNSIGMLQELDMLRQSIGALADYLGQISAATDHTGMVDLSGALRGVPLRDMATRLGGEAKIAPRAGHAELF